MFISTYENKLDKKGRVSVPAPYRSHLSALGYNSVVCYPSFTNSSIEFCPQNRLEKIIESIDTLNPFEENRDIFSTSILANSFQLNFDSEGRVSLTDKLLSHSGVKEKVLFVGQGKTFQMWEPSIFKKFSYNARKKASLKRAELKWKQTN
ncbi:MAG: transcriptional regulator MraZ [Candidatus Pelagibacter sp.]|nr:transcriptional regulator MraZ [Candidatus Pelagibacter sp.]OUV87818.1 MAG: cell division/cell wall cluster transcriptional repressor MraZ [Pelagibacteraceae bacterium TMED136]|tara:strand:+ start:207 stop:656 length:450 start_codon:yes stop_codon:yes gene_type:complete